MVELVAAVLRSLPPVETSYRSLLTGFPVKEYFFENARSIATRIVELGGRPDVVYLNVGNLKAFNARHGYEAGDDLLRFVAESIRETFSNHLVAYFGDDRFVMFCNETDVGERLVQLDEMVRAYGTEQLTAIRAGVFRFWEVPETDIRIACDAAKMACDALRGRYNQVYRVYDSSMGLLNEKRQQVLDRFDGALEEGCFQVFFQPIIRASNNQICEAEALVHWMEEDGSVVSPGDFIPALEDARLIHRLDLHMLQLICDTILDLQRRGLEPCPVTLNLSRHDFEVCDIVPFVCQTLERNGVSPDLLRVEVTEGAFIDNPAHIKETVERFHEFGIQVWMDDFGSGYSSLNTLREYEFDVIKIDMNFLRDLDSPELERRSHVMLQHLVDMAKQLGLQTLTEGVENAE